MEFRTIVDIPKPAFEIVPCEPLLFVGSCFAAEMSRRFREEAFPVVVNPYGTMYNPASILHTIQRILAAEDDFTLFTRPSTHKTAFLTLGTNHIYRLRATGEIVDNCEKRPQALFQEEELSVDACADYLRQSVDALHNKFHEIQVVITVSPIRYRKYGYHASQVSKATLLLAVNQLAQLPSYHFVHYFPAYEIVMDELRDYRFYASDMLHPSQQAVDYIWERLVETFFSSATQDYLHEWQPVKQALSHRPFNPDSAEHQAFIQQTQMRIDALRQRYSNLSLDYYL